MLNMKIAIISDSHDHLEHLQKAVEIIKKQGIETVLHLGDYVSPFSIPPFAGLKLIGVFGNNDGEKAGLTKKFAEIKGELLGDFGEIKLDGVKFALYHGTDPFRQEEVINCGKYDVVCFGHNHQKETGMQGQTLLINPGTVHGFGAPSGPTFVVFDTETREVEFVAV